MKRLTAAVILFGLLAISCGGSEGDSAPDLAAVSGPATTCLANDPDCADGADGGAADPLPDAIALTDEGDAPLPISFSGFFYSDGQTSRLCSSLAESFPPQCGEVVIDIDAPLETVLEYVAESFGNPEDAKINIDQGIYWTEDWINLSGTLNANRLVLE